MNSAAKVPARGGPVLSILAALLVVVLTAEAAWARSDGLGIRDGDVQVLDLPADLPDEVTVEIVVDGAPRSLRLRRYDLRSVEFRVIVEDGPRTEVRHGPPARTYRGHVLGRAGTRVAASMREDGLHASVIDGDVRWFVQPLAGPGVAAGAHVAYVREAVEDGPWTCAVADAPVLEEAAAPLALGDNAPCLALAPIAFDADYAYFELNGMSVDATVADIEMVLNAVDFVYASQLGIGYELTTIIVQSSSKTEPYDETVPALLLDQFRTAWNSTYADVQRSVAHLMTGRDLTGSVIGIAYLGSVCINELAYGLSQSRYSENFARRVELTAHELGHNWNAVHCDDDADCGIMCSSISGCTGVTNLFGDRSRDAILAYAIEADCFDTTGQGPIDAAGELLAGDPEEASGLGAAVAIDGAVAVAGAFMADSLRGADTGAAYVYEIVGDGWIQTKKLVASDGEPGDRFGIAVGVSGARAVVGAFLDDDGKIAAGSAYVFRDDGFDWVEEQKIQGEPVFNGDQFGNAVAISGDWLLIGAPGDDEVATNAGAAYVFRFEGGSWEQQARLAPMGALPNDSYGGSVALSPSPAGMVAVIGGRFADDPGFNSGGAYVFRLGEDDEWIEEQRLTPEGLPAGAEFGYAVDVDNDLAIVGAFRETDLELGVLDGGAAYLFFREPVTGTWLLLDRLTPPDPMPVDRFGISVGVNANGTAIVGAYLDDSAGSNSGSVHVFERLSGGAWAFAGELTGPDAGPNDQFGVSASLGTGAVCVGAWLHDHLAADAGAAYVLPLDAGIVDCNFNGIPDGCDISLGDSTDCNGNAAPDECDIAAGLLTDADGNGFPDECDSDCNRNGVSDYDELVAGGPDCNGNFVLDECDITGGTSTDLNGDGLPDECGTDCNENGVPDEVDVELGTSVDCNANGVPDECDLLQYTFFSGTLSPVGDEPHAVLVVLPPLALDDVEVSFTAHGDFSDSSEYVWVSLDGQLLDRVLQFGATACPLDDPTGTLPLSRDDLTIPMERWNAAIGDGLAVVFLETSAAVDPVLCDTPTFITVSITYPGGDCDEDGVLDACQPEIVDCNGNLVPDECEADCNDNGQADACDIAGGTSADDDGNGVPDECDPAPCPADIDGNGVVDVDDLITVILAWNTLNDDADVTGDGAVNVDDLIAVILGWGKCG